MTTRNRLTAKTAADLVGKAWEEVLNRPEDINPVTKYENAKGPSDWAEDQVPAAELTKKHEDETNRGESGLPKSEENERHVRNVRAAEAKATLAVVACDRMLPGAPQVVLTKLAGIMMGLPFEGLKTIVASQETYASLLGEAIKNAADECADGEEKEEKTATEEVPAEGTPAEEVPANDVKTAEADRIASLEQKIAELTQTIDTMKEAKAEEPTEAPAAEGEDSLDNISFGDEGKEVKTASVKMASSQDSELDHLFAPVQAAQPRIGAGLSKAASESRSEADLLSALMSSAPDVSRAFR